jgi:TonB family protein
MPGLPVYGAAELKRNYRRYFVRGLVYAGLFHCILLGMYWLGVTLFPQKEKTYTRVVRIMKYQELGPPPSVTESTWEEEASPAKGAVQAGPRSRSGSVEGKRRMRASLSRQVSGKGILGIMTGVGSVTIGEGTGLLGAEGEAGAGVGQNLDRLLSSVEDGGTGNGEEYSDGDAEAYDASDGGGVRGGRSDALVTIDDLMSKLGDSKRETVSRKGQLKIESTSDVAGQAKKSVHRSPDAIHEVMLRHVSAVRYCYDRELRKNPTLKGKIVVRITVAPDGTVKDASVVSSTLNDANVESCILSRIHSWNDFEPISASEGDVTFRQVYTFGS